MPTVPVAPNTVLASTGLKDSAGTTPPALLTDLDEAPASSDGQWWDAITLPFSTRLGFPDTGTLTGTQTFECLLRKVGEDFAATVSLYSNGVLVRSAAPVNITSPTGQVVTFTFDAAEVSNPADVEIVISGAASTAGAASTRTVRFMSTNHFAAPIGWVNGSVHDGGTELLAFATAGRTWTNIKDVDGLNTPFDVAVTSANLTGSNSNGTSSGGNTGVFPDAVMQQFVYAGDATTPAAAVLTFDILGLDPAKFYNLKLSGSRSGIASRITVYSVTSAGGTTSQELDAANNVNGFALFTGLSPIAGSNKLTVELRPKAGSTFGYLSGWELEEVTTAVLVAPAGFTMMGDFKTDFVDPPDWGDTSYNIYLPTWEQGPESQGDPSRVIPNVNKSVTLTAAIGAAHPTTGRTWYAGSMQMIRPKIGGTGSFGAQIKVTQSNAVSAIFAYASNGKEFDFEATKIGGIKAMQPNVHMPLVGGGSGMPNNRTMARAPFTGNPQIFECIHFADRTEFYSDGVKFETITPADFIASGYPSTGPGSFIWDTTTQTELIMINERHGAWAGWLPADYALGAEMIVYAARAGSTLALGGGPGAPPTPVIPAGRIAEISVMATGKTAVVPQAYHNTTAVEAADPNTHVTMGTFTHTAVKSGAWSDPTLWNTGTVPGANAIVNTGEWLDVAYDLESDVLVKDIHTPGTGTLRWATNKDTRLWADSIVVHGVFIMGEPGAPMPDSPVAGKPRAEIVFWQSEAPGITTRLGLVTHGPVRIHEAFKKERLFSDVEIPVNANSITLPGLADANWPIGASVLVVATSNAGTSSTDSHYLGPTQFYGPVNDADGIRTQTLGFKLSHDEVRTITGKSGNTITLSAPLAYAHKAYSETFKDGTTRTRKPCVALLSHAIRIRSATAQDTPWVGDLANLQKRGHCMFMASDDIQIRGVEFKDLGRTDSNPSQVRGTGEIAYRTADTSQPITVSTNVKARYPCHIHGTGEYRGRKMVAVEQCSVWAPTANPPCPGKGFVHHKSRAAFERCVGYHVRGSLMMSEVGGEQGQWIDNTLCWAPGDGFDIPWGSRTERWQDHQGHAGVGCENQARQVLIQGTIVSSCQFAQVWFQQNAVALPRVPDTYSTRVTDPVTQGGKQGLLQYGGVTAYGDDNDTYGIEQPQIIDPNNNVAYGCKEHGRIAHRQFTDRGELTPMIAVWFDSINCGMTFDLDNYSFYYSFYQGMSVNDVKAGTAIQIGDNTWDMNWVDCVFRNWANGFSDDGLAMNWNGFWVDNQFFNVDNPFVNTKTYNIPQNDPTTNPFYGAMGPWTIVSQGAGSVVKPRIWTNLNSNVRLANGLISDLPKAPLGKGGVEPSPGTPRPYFVMDVGSDTTLDYLGLETISLSGVIVDEVGVRMWPQGFTSAIYDTPVVHLPPRKNYYTPGVEIVRRNGCFQDGGVWKSRLWFTAHDRLTKAYFPFFIDVTLANFPADILAANTIPNANFVKPDLPLKLEALRQSAYVKDLTPPLITSATTIAVLEERPLAHRLTANEGQGTFALTGGASQAQGQIVKSGGVSTLQWLNNGVKNFEAPTGVNGSNAYEFQITFTSYLGVASAPVLHTVNVGDALENVTSFEDTFTGTAGALLADRLGWELLAGDPAVLNINANGVNLDHDGYNGMVKTIVGLPDMAQVGMAMEINFAGGQENIFLGALYKDPDNYLQIYRLWDSMVYVKPVVNGAVGSGAKYGNPNGNTVRVECSATGFIVKFAGVTQAPTGSQVLSAPAGGWGTRGAIIVTKTSPQVPWLDRVKIERI